MMIAHTVGGMHADYDQYTSVTITITCKTEIAL
jgi:hypothetical protein